MESTEPNNDLSESEFDDMMRDSAEATGPISRERAEGFYDRLRDRIRKYLAKKGKVAGKSAEYLLLVPDMFMLLWRLVNDGRVNSKNKVLLGSGLAYYLFPLDILPEAILGPMGYADDLIFGVYLLNKILADTDVEILREHWSGSEDILETIRKVLHSADNLVGSDVLNRIKKVMK